MRRIHPFGAERAQVARIALPAAAVLTAAIVLGGLALALSPAALLALLLAHDIFVGEELIARGRDHLTKAGQRSPKGAGAARGFERAGLSLWGPLLALSLASRGPPSSGLFIRAA